ncbi:Imm10 family immunity protein [Paenibacillus sp. PK3_47]|uniref:Imm10 family immunity protein n=1 Tax=Paenibacillus sp. PK3_47 TaxID=2072642 RepID=UPI00201D9641|nr:Imm10 family immunity protein [Paenibacillus sp. PK3_47]
MNTVLNAGFLYAGADEETDVLLIGFADDEFDPQEYILLQKTLDPGEEDAESGFDKIHISYNNEAQSMYGGILKLYFSASVTEITLTEEAAGQLNCTRKIVIKYDQEDADLPVFHKYLLQMFADDEEVLSLDL